MSQAWHRPSTLTPPRRNPAPVAANDAAAEEQAVGWIEGGAIIALGLAGGVIAWAIAVGLIYLAFPL